jgi:hypothetical protein
MTAIAQAMKKAGVDTNAALLRKIAEDCLRKAGLSPRMALAEFTSEVRDGAGCMAALISRGDTELFAIEYLERVAADMRGDNLRNSPARESATGDGKGQVASASDGCSRVALPENSAQADGGGRHDGASDGRGQLAPSNNSPQGGAGGRRERAGDGLGSPAPGESSAVPRGEAMHAMPATARGSLPSPGKPRGGEALRQMREAFPSVFDTYTMSDGTKLGDLRYSQLDRVFTKSARDAAMVWVIRNAGKPSDPNMRVREYLSERQIDLKKIENAQAMIEHAAEENHAS